MAFTLTGSVGRMGGLNKADDVRKVQTALNKVPVTSGGPAKPLETATGICGPKTIEAIQLFQIKHFGWSGADGRVDVNGVTHQKLNEFDGPVAGPTVDPVVTKEGISIRLDAGPIDSKFLTDQWRLMFTDEATARSRVYRLDRSPNFKPSPTALWGSSLAVDFDEPRTPEDFHDALFSYTSRLHYVPNPEPRFLWINTMQLQPVGGQRHRFLRPPWTIGDCTRAVTDDPTVESTTTKSVMGQLKLVEGAEPVIAPPSRVPTEAEKRFAESRFLAAIRRT